VILIIGASASGKRAFAETLGYAPTEMANACLDDKPVLYNLQELVWRDPGRVDELLPRLLEKEAVLCDEVGSGVIPVVRNDAAARRAVGKLCILLAQQAECVVRMVCGIPTVIKGTLPRAGNMD
jgi:adenosyl cobinamide kinase/adenosyl cobinamide phosphate guanylyltransferase